MPSATIRTHRMPIGTRCNLDQFMGSRQGCLLFYSLVMALLVQLRSGPFSMKEADKAYEEGRWHDVQRPVNMDHVLYFYKGYGNSPDDVNCVDYFDPNEGYEAKSEGKVYTYAIHFQFNNKYVTWRYQTKEMRDEDYRRLDQAFVREPY